MAKTDAQLKAILAEIRTTDKCAWAPQNDSRKAWYFPVAHPDDDLQSLSDMRVWNFCPYCGKEIEVRKQANPEGQSK